MQRVIDIRAKAFNTQDLPLYLSVISTSYKDDHGLDFNAIRNKIESGFKAVAKISYISDSQKITIMGNKAENSGSYRIKIIGKEREIALEGHEHIVLAKGPDGWKIISGL